MEQIGPQHLVAQMIESASARAKAQQETLSPVPLPGIAGHAVALPPAISIPPRPLSEIIRARRSGGLCPGPVPAGVLSKLLITGNPAALRKAFGPKAPCPALMPILWDVERLPAGAYRYDPETHTLLPVPLKHPAAALRTLFLQQEHQSASAALIFAAPMSSWLAREGDRGYRAMALQIGMMTDTLYLVAEALGLTYTASGGFPPASIDAALGLNGVTHSAFFSFIIGGPRP